MLGDLGFADLFRSPEEIAQAHQDRLAKAEEMRQAILAATGSASSDDERIRVSYSEGEGIRELYLDPRAMRLSSEELASEIARLVNEARVDAQRQVQQLVEEAAQHGTLPDPNAIVEKMPEIERSVDELVRDSHEMTQQLMAIVERVQRAAESMPTRRSDT